MESTTLFDNPVATIVLGLVYLLVLVLSTYLYVRIIRKAGYSGWWVLTLFVPVVNVVVFIMFAFAEWPVEKRARAAGGALPPGQGGTL